jgi:hypothetical protein
MLPIRSATRRPVATDRKNRGVRVMNSEVGGKSGKKGLPRGSTKYQASLCIIASSVGVGDDARIVPSS